MSKVEFTFFLVGYSKPKKNRRVIRISQGRVNGGNRLYDFI